MRGPEETLFLRFREGGSPTALGELYDLVAPELLHVALHLARDPAEAEDLLQATFLAAMESAAAYDGSRPVRPWLLGILANQSRAARRRAARRPDPERLGAKPLPSPEDEAARAELAEHLQRALFDLPAEWRAVLVLRLKHGLTAPEIAHALERPPGTVRSQLARGLERLRRALPAGLAGTLAALSSPKTRGLAEVREALLASAAAELAPLALAPTVALAPTLAGLLMKKALFAAAALAIVTTTALLVGLRREAPEPAVEQAGARASVPGIARTAHGGAALERGAPASGERPAEPRHAVREAPAARGAGAPAAGAAFGALLVRVVHEEDGSPARGTLVVCDHTPLDADLARRLSAVLDEKGAARFEQLEPGGVIARLLQGPWCVGSVRAGQTSELELSLPAGILVEGEVVDAEGEAIPEAAICLSDRHDGTISQIVARADLRGRFRVHAVQPGQYVSARAPGRAPSQLCQVHGRPGGRTQMRIVLAEAGGGLAGRVVDAEGRPVAGAEVLAGDEAPRPRIMLETGLATPGPPPARALADEDGRFALEALPTGLLLVQARAGGFAPAWSLVDVVAGAGGGVGVGAAGEVELVLAVEARVSGRVLGRGGEPVAGALIQCSPRGPFARSYTFSDARGLFELRRLPAGRLSLEASHPLEGWAGTVLALELGGRATWEALLEADRGIAGWLRDERGDPLSGWTLVARAPGTQPEDWRHARSGEDGGFLVVDLEDAPHELSVSGPDNRGGFPRLVVSDVLPGGEPLELTVDSAGRDVAALSGAVVGPGGVPVPGVLLTAWHEELKAMRTFAVDPATGRFDVPAVPPGTLVVNARSEDFPWERRAPIELAAGERRDLGTIVLTEGGRASGMIRGIADEHLSSLAILLTGETPGYAAFVDVRGREYRTGVLAPGRWTLHVRGDFTRSQALAFEARVGAELRLDVELEPAGLRRVRLLPPAGSSPATIWCAVLDEHGRQAWFDGNLANVGGAFEARVSVLPGTYRLRAYGTAGLLAEEPLVVLGFDGSQPPLELLLQ